MWFRQCWGCRAATGLINDPQRRRERKKRDFGSWEICEVPWHGSVVPVVAIPILSFPPKRRGAFCQPGESGNFQQRRIWVAAARLETGW